MLGAVQPPGGPVLTQVVTTNSIAGGQTRKKRLPTLVYHRHRFWDNFWPKVR